MNTFISSYYPLLDVQILHRYFLNVGDVGFDEQPEAAAIQAARRTYQVRDFWHIEPDEATRERLRRLGLRFRPTALGFQVVACTSDDKERLYGTAVGLPDEVQLDFHLYVADPRFVLYTVIYQRILAELTRPGGHVFVWRNAAKEFRLNQDETLVIDESQLVPRAKLPAQPLSRLGTPLGIISLRHAPQEGLRLWDREGRPLEQPFEAVLKNSHTTWFRVDADYPNALQLSNGQMLNGYSVGEYPLTSYGSVEVLDHHKKPLPNPTPATTIQDQYNFFSLIY